MKDVRHIGEAKASPASPEISRARSALEQAQSDLFIVQTKLAPLRQQERRALDKVAECARRVRVLEGEELAGDAAPTRALVELARIYEGMPPDDDATPCDVEPYAHCD
jgi:flagellar motility protein MotE (MotC chaperone)